MSVFRRGEGTAKVSLESPEGGFLGPLRTTALVAVIAGAVGSVGLTLRAGRHAPRILLVLFATWVLFPFVALLMTSVVSRRWPLLTQATLYGVMLVVTMGSLAIYRNVVLGGASTNPTPTFVLVPPASCLLIAIAISLAALIARRRTRRSSGS